MQKNKTTKIVAFRFYIIIGTTPVWTKYLNSAKNQLCKPLNLPGDYSTATELKLYRNNGEIIEQFVDEESLIISYNNSWSTACLMDHFIRHVISNTNFDVERCPIRLYLIRYTDCRDGTGGGNPSTKGQWVALGYRPYFQRDVQLTKKVTL